ncbi:MAG: DUF1211 domain-containing protein [Caldilineaceae bacterium]|nr:DUF1211 domain-containing protein [Caldilineaceae bacterium]
MTDETPQASPDPEPVADESLQLGLERIVFFSDAVFAIAITLLALEIRLPEGDFSDNAALTSALLAMWPKYLAFGISFWVIASFWLGHHRMFLRIKRFDRRLILLNFVLLMLIAFIPFPTTLISEYGNRTASIFYASTMVAIGLTLAAMTVYAAGPGHLVDETVGSIWRQRGLWRSLAVAGVFALSIVIAFFSADLAMYSWLLLAPVSFLGRDHSHG